MAQAERLVFLGTGHAHVTQCYNACFALCRNGEFLLTDAGGGNGILFQLQRAGLALPHYLFLSHTHTDHLLGAVWICRMVAVGALEGTYTGVLHIYGLQSVLDALLGICKLTLQDVCLSQFAVHISLHPVCDGQEDTIMDCRVTYMDTLPKSCPQLGYALQLPDGTRLVFCGDEPYRRADTCCLEQADWMIHEASIVTQASNDSQRHASLADTCRLAADVNVRHLILTHTVEEDLPNRKKTLTALAHQFYHGAVFVPDDLDTVWLKGDCHD